VCEKHGVEYEGDVPHGKGWHIIRIEWHRAITRLAVAKPIVIFVSHSREAVIETKTGTVYRIVPTLPERARSTVMAIVDVIGYASTDKVIADGKPAIRRVIRTKATPEVEAGDRTGKLPDVISLSWDAFEREFREAIGKRS